MGLHSLLQGYFYFTLKELLNSCLEELTDDDLVLVDQQRAFEEANSGAEE
jgi:hypothetical protein